MNFKRCSTENKRHFEATKMIERNKNTINKNEGVV